MPSFDYVFPGDPNATIESQFPQTSGSLSNPLLICWTTRRLLYVNTGGSPLWLPVAQVLPDVICNQLSQPLLGTVIAKLLAEPINSPLCEPFARLLARGF